METLLRRAAATSVPMGSLVKLLIAFAMMPARAAPRTRLGVLAALPLAGRL
ncbi:MAG TPA: hypothetical protein VGJ20_13270 [Xanthobacteraceae bacterium]|jgi:hypothetical protein